MNKKVKRLRYDRIIILLALLAIIFFLIYFTVVGIKNIVKYAIDKIDRDIPEDVNISLQDYDKLLPAIAEEPEPEAYTVTPLISDEYTEQLGSSINSKYAILYCVDDRQIIAQKASQERMYPASMTKIMTLIVAVENIEDYSDTFTMTFEIINPLYLQNATVTGLTSGETVPIIDLLYGIILPSGADACDAIAQYVCGDEESFVELMNQKAAEMGLKDTHFTNTSGLHNNDHYTTAHDMGLILDYALHNETCRRILSTYRYTTTSTPQHPNGIEFYSTMFNKVDTDQIEGIEICGGKTGYTYEAHHCLASFALKGKKTYIAVTGYGFDKYSPVYDMIAMYTDYLG